MWISHSGGVAWDGRSAATGESVAAGCLPACAVPGAGNLPRHPHKTKANGPARGAILGVAGPSGPTSRPGRQAQSDTLNTVSKPTCGQGERGFFAIAALTDYQIDTYRCSGLGEPAVPLRGRNASETYVGTRLAAARGLEEQRPRPLRGGRAPQDCLTTRRSGHMSDRWSAVAR